MVSAGEILRPPPALSTATPFLASSKLTNVQAYPISSWKPRGGLNKHLSTWATGVRRLLAAHDLSEQELEEHIAQCRSILSGAQPYTLSENPVEALTEAKLLTNNIHQWQAINTSVFWHVLASVDQISSYALLDIPFIENMCHPLLSDGLGLVRYLRSVADSSDGHQSNATSGSNLDLPRPDDQPTLGKDMAPCGDEGKSKKKTRRCDLPQTGLRLSSPM